VRATLDHFEIPVEDIERLTRFLETVFEWTVEDGGESPGASTRGTRAGERYRRLSPRASAVEPALLPTRVGLFQGPRQVLDAPVPVVRVRGETLEACLERVRSAGGRVLLDPQPVGTSGRFARFEDPEGNAWGLWQQASDFGLQA